MARFDTSLEPAGFAGASDAPAALWLTLDEASARVGAWRALGVLRLPGLATLRPLWATTERRLLARSVVETPVPRDDAGYVLGVVPANHSLEIDWVNEALERSLSWKGLKCRVEAWRTGKPFAEVVLIHP